MIDDTVAITKRLTGSNSILDAEWDTTHLKTRTIWYVLPCSPNPFFYKYSHTVRSVRGFLLLLFWPEVAGVCSNQKTHSNKTKASLPQKCTGQTWQWPLLSAYGIVLALIFLSGVCFQILWSPADSTRWKGQHVSKIFVIRAIWFAKLHQRSETGSSTAWSKWSL